MLRNFPLMQGHDLEGEQTLKSVCVVQSFAESGDGNETLPILLPLIIGVSNAIREVESLDICNPTKVFYHF